MKNIQPPLVLPPAPTPAPFVVDRSGYYHPEWQGYSQVVPALVPVRYQQTFRREQRRKMRKDPLAGCVSWLIVAMIIMILLAGGVGVGLTILTPTITVVGGAITRGNSFHLHGKNFVPYTTVTVTHDDALPVTFTQSALRPQEDPAQSTRSYSSQTQTFLTLRGSAEVTASPGTVTIRQDGTFDVNVVVSLDWLPGLHRLQASENLTPRAASLPITIYNTGAAPRPAATANPTKIANTSGTATVTRTNFAPGLDAVIPNIVMLGPIDEGNSQQLQQQITLETGGTTQVQWNATWDHNQAPWLQMSSTTGQIQAPGSQQLTLTAQAGNLRTGMYTTIVTFNSSIGQPVSLAVNLSVQQGCINASPSSINFNATENASDPVSQTLTLNNCSLQPETWSVSTINTTGTDPAWLVVNPGQGSINPRNSQQISIQARSAETQLKTGTYQATLKFSNGTSEVSVPVTLNVQAGSTTGPILLVSTPDINAHNCTLDQLQQNWLCNETLASSGTAGNNLPWNVSSMGIEGITFTDANGNTINSGTLTQGQAIQLTIKVPKNACQTPISLLFTGPANTVTVPWTC